MRKVFLIAAITMTCNLARGQQYVPFPDQFIGTDFLAVKESFVSIGGYYSQGDRKTFSVIFKDNEEDTLKKMVWTSSATDTTFSDGIAFKMYNNQLFECKYNAAYDMGYLFDKKLNYIKYIGSAGYERLLDSISQASGINDILSCKDTLMYASVKNDDRNIIVRKKGIKGNWNTLPIVVYKAGPVNNLGNIFLGIGLFLLLAAVIIYSRFIRKGKEIEAAITDSNAIYNQLKLTADKPLDYEQLKNKEGTKDAIDAIDAIVEVIQNRNTPLPMTVAINGAWGSGKSTIMNCIRQKLDVDNEKRFITTWFNAWHQQSESSLLNAFLLKIIDRYEKPFFKNNLWKAGVAFFRFRVKLAWSRFIKWPFYNQFLSGFALSFLSLMITIIIFNLYGLADNSIFKKWGFENINFQTLFSDGNLKSIQTLCTVMAIVLSVCSFFILRSESTPTIGAFLNVIYKKSFLVEAEKNNPDLREKFRSQYWEIMEAVEDRVLIVLIDDLDRVSGDKIFEMLEAINFIGDVTSRPDDSNKHSLKTVFVLGLYIDQVAEQLGIFIQKDNPLREKNDTEKAKNEAKALGKRYLEKMIQLNVPVPLPKKTSKNNNNAGEKK